MHGNTRLGTGICKSKIWIFSRSTGSAGRFFADKKKSFDKKGINIEIHYSGKTDARVAE